MIGELLNKKKEDPPSKKYNFSLTKFSSILDEIATVGLLVFRFTPKK